MWMTEISLDEMASYARFNHSKLFENNCERIEKIDSFS